MNQYYSLIFTVWISFYIFVVNAKLILKKRVDYGSRSDYSKNKPSNKVETHKVTIALVQNNLDVLTEKLYDVSTPSSANYGKHLTYKEIGELISNPVATSAVVNWLNQNKINDISVTQHGEYIVAKANIHQWEQLLNTTFYEFSNVADTKKIVHRAEEYYIPENLIGIHEIFHVVGLPPRVAFAARRSEDPIVRHDSKNNLRHLTGSTYVYPSVLTSMYNIPATNPNPNMGSQGVYETLSQTFLPSDLALFQSTFSLKSYAVSTYIGNIPSNTVCSSTSTAFNYCGEATLDVEYILAVADQVPTTFYYDSSSSSDFVSFVVSLANSSNPAHVYSISYAAYEVDVSSSSITSFNTEAQKLGLMGTTLVVASGDDGITGFAFRGSSTSVSQCGYYAMWPASSPYVTAVSYLLMNILIINRMTYIEYLRLEVQ